MCAKHYDEYYRALSAFRRDYHAKLAKAYTNSGLDRGDLDGLLLWMSVTAGLSCAQRHLGMNKPT